MTTWLICGGIVAVCGLIGAASDGSDGFVRGLVVGAGLIFLVLVLKSGDFGHSCPPDSMSC